MSFATTPTSMPFTTTPTSMPFTTIRKRKTPTSKSQDMLNNTKFRKITTPGECCSSIRLSENNPENNYIMYTKTSNAVGGFGGFGVVDIARYKNDIIICPNNFTNELIFESNYNPVIDMWNMKSHSDEHYRDITPRYLDEEKTFLSHKEFVNFINKLLKYDKTNDINAIKFKSQLKYEQDKLSKIESSISILTYECNRSNEKINNLREKISLLE